MSAKCSFDQALNMTGFGKYNYMMILLTTSILAAMAFEIFSVSYLVPASACELNTTNFQQGFMAGIPLIGIIATSHFWGYLADTRGRKLILTWALVFGFIAAISSAFSPNWIVFSFLKFFSSCGVGSTYAIAVTLLSECTPDNRRSILIVLTSSIILVSSGVMAVLTIPILPLSFSYYVPYLNIDFNSWRLLNIIYAMPGAIAALGVYFAYESPKYLMTTGQEDEALEILRRIYVINTGKSADSYQVNSLILGEATAVHVKGLWKSMVSQTIPLLKPPLLKNTLLISTLFIIVYFCLNPYIVWLPFVVDGVMRSLEKDDQGLTFCQMMQSSQNTTTSQTSDCGLNQFAMVLVFGVSLLLSILNTILSSFINVLGKRRMLITIQLFSGIAGLLVNTSSNWKVSGPLYIAFVSGVVNFGYLNIFSVELFPTYVKAMAVCLTLMLGRGISVLGVNLLKSMLVDNCEATFYLFGGLTFVGGLIAFLLPVDVKVSKEHLKSTIASTT